MSSSRTVVSNLFSNPISEFQYRQLLQTTTAVPPAKPTEDEVIDKGQWYSEVELRSHLTAERAAAIAETEGRLRRDYEERTQRESAKVLQALERFQVTQKDYFARVEAEVVQLAVAIAGKILHREAQVDPLLLSALVRIALGQLKEGSAARIHVPPGETARWEDAFAAQPVKMEITLVADAQLLAGDCLLETELGTVNLNIEAQLKEVEKGFFDVLAQRPQR